MDYISHIAHKTVANFHSITFEDFGQFVRFMEMVVDKVKEMPSYVGFHVLAVEQFVPDNVPFNVPPLVCL